MRNMLTNLWSLCLLKVSKQSSLNVHYELHVNTNYTGKRSRVFTFLDSARGEDEGKSMKELCH